MATIAANVFERVAGHLSFYLTVEVVEGRANYCTATIVTPGGGHHLSKKLKRNIFSDTSFTAQPAGISIRYLHFNLYLYYMQYNIAHSNTLILN